MSKRIYISADYSDSNGDREVVEIIHKWCNDNLHKIDFIDTASGPDSVSNKPDCRACDLKNEFNSRINSSSAVIFIVGDKTKLREAGSKCERFKKINRIVIVLLINKIHMEKNNVKYFLRFLLQAELGV